MLPVCGGLNGREAEKMGESQDQPCPRAAHWCCCLYLSHTELLTSTKTQRFGTKQQVLLPILLYASCKEERLSLLQTFILCFISYSSRSIFRGATLSVF